MRTRHAKTDRTAPNGRPAESAAAGERPAFRKLALIATVWLFGLALPVMAFANAAPAQDTQDDEADPGYSLLHQYDPNASVARPGARPDPVRVPKAPAPSVPQLDPLNLGPVQAGIDTNRMGAYAGTQSNGISLEATMDAPNVIYSPTNTTGRLSLGVDPSVMPHGLGLSLEAASPLDLTAKPGDPTAFANGTMSLRGDLPVGNGSDLSLEARRQGNSGNDSNREVYLRYKMGW